MTNFEDELREALRAGDAPSGFANRVLAKLPEAYPPPRLMLRRVALWAAAVLVCVGSITGIQLERVKQERARGEAAKEKVMLALRITSTKLNQAQSRVREIGASEQTNGDRP